MPGGPARVRPIFAVRGPAVLTVMVVIGTRPEAIKMAPVVRALRAQGDRMRPVVLVTGQHREMLDQALELFDIAADIDLDVMAPNQTLASLTAKVMLGVDAAVRDIRPDWVLVQGDTTSAMAAGLVAFYHEVKVGHIEAGLRTGHRRQPFPDEINRRITDLMSDLYFTPTERTPANLLREGVADGDIVVTGNTVIDALLHMAGAVDAEPLHEIDADLDGKRLILVTSHRRESFGTPFRDICTAVRDLAERDAGDAHVVFPVHYNPNVREPAHEILGGFANVHLVDPVDYGTMVKLMARAHVVLTDSGGVQEEAPSLNKPLVVMRELTERPARADQRLVAVSERGGRADPGSDPRVSGGRRRAVVRNRRRAGDPSRTGAGWLPSLAVVGRT
jgi:UDP-N-acetylglucosamine 2-epimerase (non-hydrolysing)